MSFRLAAILVLFVSGAVAAAEPDYGAYTQLLQAHVVQLATGQTAVDYGGLAKDSDELSKVLKGFSAVTPSQFSAWSGAAQLAFLINTYNAYTLQLVLTKYPDILSIKDLGSWLSSPWKKEFIPLFGEMVSLDYVEHDLIRSDAYADPRIHFAVNCASVGCPALRAEAYAGARLEEQLQEQTQQYLQDASRNRREGSTLYLSKIFDWYGEDFTRGWRGFHSLPQFLQTYAPALLPSTDVKIKFLDYDWRLNDVR